MSPEGIAHEINQLVNQLGTAELLLASNATVVTRAGNRVLVTWGGGALDAKAWAPRATIEEYISHVQCSRYQAMLYDGGLLQVSYTFERGRVAGHRLCFFPCPIRFTEKDLYELSLLDLIDSLSVDELRERTVLEGPLRFDFAPEEARDHHPACHIHLNREDCRIPVASALSVGQFVRMVFGHFYEAPIDIAPILSDWACPEMGSCLSTADRDRLHFELARGSLPVLGRNGRERGGKRKRARHRR